MGVSGLSVEVRAGCFVALVALATAAIVAVNVAAASRTVRAIRAIPVCEGPHAARCQRHVIPVIFREATRVELARYERLIAARRRVLRDGP